MKNVLLLCLLTFAACTQQHPLMTEPAVTVVVPRTPIFRDDFNRTNTALGSLGTAPDGLPYDMTGLGLSSAQVNNHQYVSSSTAGPTYASKYFAGKNISRVSITFQFTQSPNAISGLALITSTDSAGVKLDNMNHWVFTGTGQTSATIWRNGAQNVAPIYFSSPKTQTYVMGKPYTISLTMDDKWVHCLLPDSSTVDMYDTQIPLVAGRRVIWEIGAGIAVTRHEVF